MCKTEAASTSYLLKEILGHITSFMLFCASCVNKAVVVLTSVKSQMSCENGLHLPLYLTKRAFLPFSFQFLKPMIYIRLNRLWFLKIKLNTVFWTKECLCFCHRLTDFVLWLCGLGHCCFSVAHFPWSFRRKTSAVLSFSWKRYGSGIFMGYSFPEIGNLQGRLQKNSYY